MLVVVLDRGKVITILLHFENAVCQRSRIMEIDVLLSFIFAVVLNFISPSHATVPLSRLTFDVVNSLHETCAKSQT
jgi:hypothetical protein